MDKIKHNHSVTIEPEKILAWLSQNSGSANCFLIYGQDEGGVLITQQRVITNILNSQNEKLHGLERFCYSDLAINPGTLAYAINSSSLFLTKKVILVQECTENFSATIFKILKEHSSNRDVVIIFIAHEVKKSSKLVKSFESLQRTVIIPCYKLDYNTSTFAIQHWFKSKSLPYTKELIDALVALLPMSRAILENELEKLYLYQLGRPISLNDVEACFHEQSLDMSFDILSHAFCLNLKERFHTHLSQALENDYSNIAILRNLQNYIARIMYVQSALKNGQSLSESLLVLNPPLFFKYKNLFLEVVTAVNIARTKSLMLELLKLEIHLKTKAAYKSKTALQQLLNQVMMQK